jgi:hypothetical protein
MLALTLMEINQTSHALTGICLIFMKVFFIIIFGIMIVATIQGVMKKR